MATDNQVIAAMLTAGALGDQAGALKDALTREATSRWVVEAYRAILRELDAEELDAGEPDEKAGSLGFSPR